jgi:hypothetical protein
MADLKYPPYAGGNVRALVSPKPARSNPVLFAVISSTADKACSFALRGD